MNKPGIIVVAAALFSALPAFAASVADERRRFASVGRYALRGVGKPQELFTLDAEA